MAGMSLPVDNPISTSLGCGRSTIVWILTVCDYVAQCDGFREKHPPAYEHKRAEDFTNHLAWVDFNAIARTLYPFIHHLIPPMRLSPMLAGNNPLGNGMLYYTQRTLF